MGIPALSRVYVAQGGGDYLRSLEDVNSTVTRTLIRWAS